MNEEQGQEVWEVEAGGQVFETNFAEMTEWIADGSLLRIDRVRKGNLRWIEAGKVPALLAVFNAKDNGQPIAPPVVSTTKLGPTVMPGSSGSTFGGQTVTTSSSPAAVGEPFCSMHEDVPAAFACKTCGNNFCKTCPNSYGGSVKICPFCGAMCEAIAKKESAVPREIYYAPAGNFGFGDFGEAIKYPFKFMPSLVMGAIMFMFLSVAQGVSSFGGIFMMWGAIACALCANTLTFGILANTVENFSQGKIGENFMPSFDDFSLWEDVVHPFFLMIGAYLSSFGPLLAVVVLAFFFIIAPVRDEINNSIETEAARSFTPDLPYAANAAEQSKRVREIVGNDANRQQQLVESVELGEVPDESLTVRQTAVDDEEARFAELQNMIQEHRKAQIEGVVGKAPETEANERMAFIRDIIGRGIIFILIAGLCLLWGLFYFPAACAVAGYTRSFAATVNPTVGLDTIRRLGVDYIKILVMCLILAIATAFVGGVLEVIFAPFSMPAIGNIPAIAVGSLFSFYTTIVFACVLGFALYKSAEKLKLYR